MLFLQPPQFIRLKVYFNLELQLVYNISKYNIGANTTIDNYITNFPNCTTTVGKNIAMNPIFTFIINNT